uniref:Uncharacterized protein n=1 Tax=Graphocephala atropunctata TaxID=36148 RepID=A0A1B6MN02_9HEMI
MKAKLILLYSPLIKAEVKVIVNDEHSTRTLRNGLCYSDFVKSLRMNVAELMEEVFYAQPQTSTQVYIQDSPSDNHKNARLSYVNSSVNSHVNSSVNTYVNVSHPDSTLILPST